MNQQAWPDRLTVTRNSGIDYYYEQYRRLLVREESLLKERETLRRANVELRSRLSSSASVPPLQVGLAVPAGLVSRGSVPTVTASPFAPALAQVD